MPHSMRGKYPGTAYHVINGSEHRLSRNNRKSADLRLPRFRRLLELTSRQQQTQRTLLDWLRVEYAAKEEG